MSRRASNSAGHEFGGVSTELKLSIVESYLKSFTTALRGQFDQLWYFDAFAGTGERTVRLTAYPGDLWTPPRAEVIEQRRGSAQIAIDISPAFDRLIFMDKTRRHAAALQQLAAEHPTRDIVVRRGDANALIRNELAGVSWTRIRGVMFLDPYGMHVDWATLEAVQRAGAIDVWYLVSLAGLFRQATKDSRQLSEQKKKAITRMLGSTEWEKAWYDRPQKLDLFRDADEAYARVADVEAIESHVKKRLESLFPKVLEPLRLSNDRGAPMFSLFFAVSNGAPLAIGLASKIANHILKSGTSSQVRPR